MALQSMQLRIRMRSLVAVALYIACVLLLLAPLSTHAAEGNIDKHIYTHYSNEGYCVRLLHQTGWIGCGLPKGGLHGRLRLALDDAAVAALVASPPSYPVALVIDPTMLRGPLVQTLQSTPGLEVVGIMLTPSPMMSPGSQTPVPPAVPYSSGPAAPQLLPYIPSSPAIPDRPSRPTRFNRSYVWNPPGDGLELQRLDRLAVVTLTATEAPHVLALAQENEESENKGDFVAQTVEFSYYMYAEENTVKCLEDTTCMPLGGQSVWGSLGNLTHNSNSSAVPPPPIRPKLLLATKQDSSAFFHQMAPGGDDTSASLAVLLATVKLLATTPGVSALPTQILFAFFDGESYSHLGSRKFVDDILNFHCLVPNDADPAGTGADCADPFKTDEAFMDLRPLDALKAIIELGQIGLNDTVFLHRERDGNTRTDEMIDRARQVAANLSTPLPIALADPDTPGIPPSASEAFLDALPVGSLPVLVLTDHAGPFANGMWHSQFDSAANLLSDLAPGSSEVLHASLCNKATFLARMAWIEAGGDPETTLTFQADCDLINKLLRCMLEDSTCALVDEAAHGAFGPASNANRVVSKYTSVYQLMPERFIGGMPLFLYNFLWPSVMNPNVTGWVPPPPGYNSRTQGAWPARPRTMHVHDAVDPNFVFAMQENKWHIKPGANEFPLWTEANWDASVGFRTFRVEDPTTEKVVFGVGIAVAVASALVVLLGQRYCNRKFKTL